MTKKYRTLLIIIFAMGILAAILTPRILDAVQKAKVKRAVSDMRSVGTAWFTWLTDQVGDGPADTASGSSAAPGSQWTADELSTVYSSAAGFYLPQLPDEDPWGNPYEYTHADSPLAKRVMQIRCFGRDGKEGGTGYDADIVWVDGFFVTYPENAQSDQ